MSHHHPHHPGVPWLGAYLLLRNEQPLRPRWLAKFVGAMLALTCVR